MLANFALNQLRLDSSPLYECGYFGKGSARLLNEAHKKALMDLRPQMVSLAEVVPSMYAPSTIGNYYGDIYENKFETAVIAPLNTGTVNELAHTHIKPVMGLNPVPKL